MARGFQWERPGAALLEEERWAALLGDTVDQLESLQMLVAHQALEDTLGTLRFVRAEILRRFDPKTGARR
jgi:hypothetical protein